MHAILKAGSRQYRVAVGDILDVDKLDRKEGSQVSLKEILLVHDGKESHIGQPRVKGASVVCDVLEHRRGAKGVAFKFRKRENYRRKKGFRPWMTRLRVKEIKLEKTEAS